MTAQLRPYQVATVEAVFDAIIDEYRRVLYTSATATGKTVVIADIVDKILTMYDWRVLVTVHRTEIIGQLYREIRDRCGLQDDMDIGVEQAMDHARSCCRVIVGNIATVRNPKRLEGWTPNVIIIDEAHRAAAASYRGIMAQYPEAIVVGCTATAKRTDKQALYALRPDNTPVRIARGKKSVDADPAETVFEKLVFDYSILEGQEDGWLVPTRGVTVRTDVDLSGIDVSTTADGETDLVQSQVLKTLEADEAVIDGRVKVAYQGWLDAAMQSRPTIAFWPGVKTAKAADEYWRSQGWKSTELNGESEHEEFGKRSRSLHDFREGDLQIIHNVALFTEGVNLPNCSGIIAAAPTMSWNRYVQEVGRGGRPTIGAYLNTLATAEERRAAIAASDKPDCLVLDVVDLTSRFDLCTAPAILDLPCRFDLEGHSVADAKRMIDAAEDAQDRIAEAHPMSYSALKVVLEKVDLIKGVSKKSQRAWKVEAGGGLRFQHCPPNYSARLLEEGGKQRLVVQHRNRVICEKVGRGGHEFGRYTDRAAEIATEAIDKHRKANAPQRSAGTGTLAWMQTWKDKGKGALYHLHNAGFTDQQIDALPRRQLFAILTPLRERYWQGRKSA